MKEGSVVLKKTYHSISVAIIVLSLLFTFFCATDVSFRTFQAGEDFGRSFLYYFAGMLNKQEYVKTTVQYVPESMSNLLPVAPEEIKALFQLFGDLLIERENLRAYFALISEIIASGAMILLALLLPLVLLYAVVRLAYSTVDTDTGEYSAPLKIWLSFEHNALLPVFNFIKGYIRFLFDKEKRIPLLYVVAFIVVWLWNLNLFTISFEIIAFLLWIPFSGEIENIFVQIAKFLLDASVIFQTVPTFLLIIIGWVLFDLVRRHIGFSRLKADEEDNKQFLKDNPGNLLATGKPRVGKTKTITDMALSQNVLFREIAQEKSRERQMQFPHFPWSVLRKTIEELRDLPNFGLQYIRDFFGELQEAFETRKKTPKEERKRKLERFRALGYQGKDFIFGYNFERYGLTYNDNLTYIPVWKAIELYAEEYAIYTSPTPLILGNYPIRTSIRWKKYGNYPLMKADFFRIKPYELVEYTEWNHIVPHDALRLGVKMNPNGEYNNSVDLGCVVLSELGKELGNQMTNRGKDNEKDSKKCNPNNDLWTTNAKMISHGLTIDYECYFRIFGDEQRAMSVLADFRELGSEMRILKKHKEKIKMPFFAFGELIYILSTKAMNKFLDYFNSRHGKVTLLEYLITSVYKIFVFDHYIRIRNQFASYRVDLKIKDDSNGEGDKDAKKLKYMISRKKTCADIYDTGYFGTVYREKFKRSKVGGLEKIPQFTDMSPTIPQMEFMGSRFNRDVFKYFNIEDTTEE